MVDLSGEEFNKEKFKQVLHYIIARCGHIDNVGKTVLYKLSYFSDFDYYELHEEKLTGESYRRLPYGPAPIHFDDVVKELESEDKISQNKVPYGIYNQFKYISKNEPVIDLLSVKERSIIDDVIRKYSCKNASEVSEISHRDIPYKATNDLDIIDYEMVFYRDPETSVRKYEDDNSD